MGAKGQKKAKQEGVEGPGAPGADEVRLQAAKEEILIIRASITEDTMNALTRQAEMLPAITLPVSPNPTK